MKSKIRMRSLICKRYLLSFLFDDNVSRFFTDQDPDALDFGKKKSEARHALQAHLSETASNELREKGQKDAATRNPGFPGRYHRLHHENRSGKSKLFYSEVTGALKRMKQPARNG